MRAAFGPLGQNPAKHETKQEPACNSTDDVARGRGEHELEHLSARCAQRHANAELIRSLSYAVRDDAEKSDCGECKRQERERAEQRGHQASIGIFVQALKPWLEVTSLAKRLLIGI